MPALDDKYFYKHSGRTGFSIPLILLVGLPISAILGTIYVFVSVYCPVVGYVNILFLVGYVLATTFVISTLAKVGKCRNGWTLFLMGCLAGLVGLYFSWLFFFKALAMMQEVDISVLGLMLNPFAHLSLIMELNKEGWWGPSGFFQWLLCAIEAVAFVFGVGAFSAVSLSRDVFCEECGNWCEKSSEKHLMCTEAFTKTLDEEDAEFNHFEILKLPETDEETLPRFQVEVLKCTGCDSTSAVRIQLLSLKEGGDGSETESTEIDGILLRKS